MERKSCRDNDELELEQIIEETLGKKSFLNKTANDNSYDDFIMKNSQRLKKK